MLRNHSIRFNRVKGILVLIAKEREVIYGIFAMHDVTSEKQKPRDQRRLAFFDTS